MELLESKVIDYYQEDKLSVQQIADKLSLPANQIYRILDLNNIQRRSRSEAIRYSHISRFGSPEFHIKEQLSEEERLLKIAGIMLYWGEGTKQRGTVALSNSNPELIRLFLRFLRIICGIDEGRLHATIHYYSDQNPETLLDFWCETTSIHQSQFYKPFLHIKRSTGTYRNPSPFGTISIQYSDKMLLEKILTWIQEYASSVNKRTTF